MLKFLLFLSFFGLISSRGIRRRTCQQIFHEAGNNPEDFGWNVGHALHSMNVRALRKFKPDVTEYNRVPTINLNLTSDEPILSYAPDRSTSDTKFLRTEGMQILDEVLSHMDDNAYGVRGFTILDKIGHAFHMEETWDMTLESYKELLKNPPNDEVCRCAMDIENNGVLDKMRSDALKLREPDLVYRTPLRSVAPPNKYSPGFYDSFEEDENVYDPIAQNGEAYDAAKHSHDPQKTNSNGAKIEHLDKSENAAHLIDEKTWKLWKDLKHHHHSIDAATFLYCALQD